LLLLVQGSRRAPREPLAGHHRWAETEEAVEVIDRGEREVHRARRPTPLELQITLEVTAREVPRAGLAQRAVALRALREHATYTDTCAAYAWRVRTAGEILKVPAECAARGVPRRAPVVLVEAVSGRWPQSICALVDPRPDGSFV